MYHAKYRSWVGVEKNHVDYILESMIEFIIFIYSVWIHRGGQHCSKIFLGVKELPEWLKMQTNTRRQRQANRKDDRDVQEEEEKNGEQKNDEIKKDDREPETNGKTE